MRGYALPCAMLCTSARSNAHSRTAGAPPRSRTSVQPVRRESAGTTLGGGTAPRTPAPPRLPAKFPTSRARSAGAPWRRVAFECVCDATTICYLHFSVVDIRCRVITHAFRTRAPHTAPRARAAAGPHSHRHSKPVSQRTLVHSCDLQVIDMCSIVHRGCARLPAVRKLSSH